MRADERRALARRNMRAERAYCTLREIVGPDRVWEVVSKIEKLDPCAIDSASTMPAPARRRFLEDAVWKLDHGDEVKP